MPQTHRNTKIVATLGPTSDSPEVIRKLIAAGVDVFRLNASHGTQAEHGVRLQTVRALAKEANVRVGILLDLQGPKIRLGKFEGGSAMLATGSRFTITTEECLGNAERASTVYSGFAADVQAGDRVLLADGSIELRAVKVDGKSVECEVVSGGPISDRKGINLPGVAVSSPALTKKDKSDLIFGLEAGIDMVALSFVRRRDDMLRLRHFLEEHESTIPMIAKIEKPEGWTNLDEILEETDGVMVARGDLGVEMALEKVPFIQKSIIERARARGRFIITATQMLESMIEHPVPTRAEVSDIANAIYDGTDAVMLSAETSAGRYPVEAVKVMARVAAEAEASVSAARLAEAPRNPRSTTAEIVADSAFRAARLMGASAIVVFTSTGNSVRLVSRYRPSVPIYSFTPSEAVARQLSVIYGARAIEAPVLESTDMMMDQMDRMLVEQGWAKPGDKLIFVAGQPIGRPGSTNVMKLHTVEQDH